MDLDDYSKLSETTRKALGSKDETEDEDDLD